jgi:hypothetical protein
VVCAGLSLAQLPLDQPVARALRKLKTIYIRGLQQILGEGRGEEHSIMFLLMAAHGKKVRQKKEGLLEAQNEMRQKMAEFFF